MIVFSYYGTFCILDDDSNSDEVETQELGKDIYVNIKLSFAN